MQIPRTHARPDHSDDMPPTYVNTDDSHWWDGSQIYGRTTSSPRAPRRRGRQTADRRATGCCPHDPRRAIDLTGVDGQLLDRASSMLHTLFTLEHNAICDRLRADVPDLVRRASSSTARAWSTPR